ncbi:MAG TPA: DUF429 domain-containing protein [Saprospiraceae bacterium]|nr:DUF429 domain-containing protein [Saprospiraceae bacterium]HMQ81813.1 DUF429 domain-containing protein [Saprospiraceae bacterium]
MGENKWRHQYIHMIVQSATLAGIDFGSQLAGTTVIAFLQNQAVCFAQSSKKKSADTFILDWVENLRPTLIGIDAPLSLPGVYQLGNPYEDYHFREADRLLKAMSPMFLGGLTARAMQLKTQLSKQFSTQIIEVYPAQLIITLQLPATYYKKKHSEIAPMVAQLQELYPFSFSAESVLTWHHLDALLALWSTWRYQQGNSLCFGNQEEGVIIV